MILQMCAAGSTWADGPALPEALPVLVSGEKHLFLNTGA